MVVNNKWTYSQSNMFRDFEFVMGLKTNF